MPDDRVQTGRDNRLPFDDLYRRGGVTILLDHKEVYEDSKRHETISEYGDDVRDGGRPTETMVENDDHDRRRKQWRSQSCDNLLYCSLLGRRTHVHSAFEKLLVIERYVDRGKRCGDCERQEKCPALPIIERPRGNKNDRSRRDASYPAPPAQIRTGPIKASGSCLG